MKNEKLVQYIIDYDIIYLIDADLTEGITVEYGDKNKLLYNGIIKANFYDTHTIYNLNQNLKHNILPQVFRQGKVVGVIGKPNETNIVGIFYHEYKTPKESIKWAKEIWNYLPQLWN